MSYTVFGICNIQVAKTLCVKFFHTHPKYLWHDYIIKTPEKKLKCQTFNLYFFLGTTSYLTVILNPHLAITSEATAHYMQIWAMIFSLYEKHSQDDGRENKATLHHSKNLKLLKEGDRQSRGWSWDLKKYPLMYYTFEYFVIGK